MRALFTLLTAGAILCGAASTTMAQGYQRNKDNVPPKSKKADGKYDRIAFIKLQIKFHRTMADLLEARIAEEPDKEKIAELSREVRKLQQEMQKMMPRRGGRGGRGPGGMGPGPGMGQRPDGDYEGGDHRPPRGDWKNRRGPNDDRRDGPPPRDSEDD